MSLHLFTESIKSVVAEPQIHPIDPPAECLTFTVSKKQTWLFTPDDASHPLVPGLLSEEDHWNIVTYDKKILQVVAPALAEAKADVNMMYDMKLGQGKGLNPRLDEELEAAGMEIVDGREWFLKTHPTKANALSKQQVWIARSRDDPSVIMGDIIILTTPSEVYISEVVVQPAHQSKGIAKKLLNFVHAKVQQGQEQVKSVWLHVFGENPTAVGLYISLGYRIEKVMWLVSKAKAAPAPAEGATAPNVPAAVPVES